MWERRFVAMPLFGLLCYFTFVVAAKPLAEEAKSIQPPTCSFEVDGIEQTCAKFETGCNTSEQYLEVHDLEYIDFSRNRIDYLNITFNINFNDGMLLLYQTEDCWTFQLTRNVDDTDLSNVKLKFNFIPNNHMLHPGYIYHKDDVCPIMHVKLEGRLHPASREFTIQILQPGKIKTAEVTLMGAECYINCSGVVNACEVDRLETIQLLDVNQEIVFTNLTYGHYYCIRVEESSDCPAVHTDTRQLKLVVNTVQPIEITSETLIKGVVILSILAFVGVITATVVIILKHLRENDDITVDAAHEEVQEHLISEWQSMPPSPTVLLLYSRDAPEFCEVMKALRKLLVRCGNMEVLDPFDQARVEEVSRNISGWLLKHMSRPDVKIVIVESEGSYIRQQAYFSTRRALRATTNCLDNVLTFALTELHNDFHLREDYDRLFRIRFSFTENRARLKHIVPRTHYSLVQQLATFIMDLKAYRSAKRLTLEDIRLQCPNELDDLEHWVFNMQNVLMSNPHHIRSHFMSSSF